MILQKVSFDKDLFSKELKKAYQHLSQEDSLQLNFWLLRFIKKNVHLNEVRHSFFLN
tara:strand:- start:2446 stop:2616 length:171 start_codon:yes stop_codon:yes gene_type:complete